MNFNKIYFLSALTYGSVCAFSGFCSAMAFKRGEELHSSALMTVGAAGVVGSLMMLGIGQLSLYCYFFVSQPEESASSEAYTTPRLPFSLEISESVSVDSNDSFESTP